MAEPDTASTLSVGAQALRAPGQEGLVPTIRKDRYQRKSRPGARGDLYGTTRWTGVILGSVTAFGLVLTLSAIAGIVVVAILTVLGTAGASEGGASSLVGVSLTLVLAFYLGGYVAGRTATRSGARHGLLVALLALVVAIFLAAMGIIFGSGLVNSLSGLRLPSSLEDIQNLGMPMTVSGVLALTLPFIGGALGGTWGAKMGRRRRRS